MGASALRVRTSVIRLITGSVIGNTAGSGPADCRFEPYPVNHSVIPRRLKVNQRVLAPFMEVRVLPRKLLVRSKGHMSDLLSGKLYADVAAV